MLLTFTFAVLAFVGQDRGASGAMGDLAAAKALYASGDYEEALSKLPAAADAGPSADEANQYRALCALALGRTTEAQRSLEELITRRPLYKMSEAEVSPKLVAMFHDARRRLLPNLVRGIYVAAKTNFDQKRYELASTQLKDLLTLLNDPDLGTEAGMLGDLKLLADGFVKLADSEIAAAAAAKPKPAEPPPPAAAPAGPPPVRVYTSDDKDVVAPAEIRRTLPPWKPVTPADRNGHSGVLRVVIDEQGKVESMSLIRSVAEGYDAQLLAAARDWVFKPATKAGQPVKYQKLIAITLSPR
jgi:TonB family protein